MEAEFWHERWQSGQIGFHEGQANALLVAHLTALALPDGARIFLPLCGKTRDIAWLLGQGFCVAGAELSEIAIQDLFSELDVRPEVSELGPLKRYTAPKLDIFVGDIFNLDAGTLGPVEAAYDRAALVAMPDGMRTRYAGHLSELTHHAQQLLITFSYDQSLMAGPPFSVPEGSVASLYTPTFTLTKLASAQVEGKLKGQVDAEEIIWHLKAAV